eukprot:6174363-Pleurochrysis_carterae.AAC.5
MYMYFATKCRLACLQHDRYGISTKLLSLTCSASVSVQAPEGSRQMHSSSVDVIASEADVIC